MNSKRHRNKRSSKFEILISNTYFRVFIIGCLAAFFYLGVKSQDPSTPDYKGLTVGQVTNIEVRQGIDQTRYGSKSRIYSYRVTFEFEVEGKRYTKTEFVNGQSSINRKLIHKLNTQGRSGFYGIKYNKDNPTSAYLGR